jgi:hypothetical protein
LPLLLSLAHPASVLQIVYDGQRLHGSSMGYLAASLFDGFKAAPISVAANFTDVLNGEPILALKIHFRCPSMGYGGILKKCQ